VNPQQQATPAPASTGATITGLPLWLDVKKTIFNYWVDANELLYFMDKTRSQTSDWNERTLGRTCDAFKASVLRLYRSVWWKLKYHKDKEEVKALVAMNLDECVEYPNRFTLDEAIKAFKLLSAFLEYDGITFFEDEHPSPVDYGLVKMDE